MSTLTNNEDPDEMPHIHDIVAFHQGLHCLLRQKQSSKKEIHLYLEIITCDPSIYTMNHPLGQVNLANGKVDFISTLKGLSQLRNHWIQIKMYF